MSRRDWDGCGTAVPPHMQKQQISTDISVHFIFISPGSSNLFIFGTVKRFPLTSLFLNNIQQCAEGKL